MSYDTAFSSATKIAKDAALSCMECVLPAHTVNRAPEDMKGTVAKSDSDAFEHKLELHLWSAVKLWSDLRRKIERVLVSLSVVTKTEVEAIVETSLNKCTSNLQSQIVEAV